MSSLYNRLHSCFGYSDDCIQTYPPHENLQAATLNIVHYTLCTVHCTLYTMHCTLYTVHYVLYTVHCTLYTSYTCILLQHSIVLAIKMYTQPMYAVLLCLVVCLTLLACFFLPLPIKTCISHYIMYILLVLIGHIIHAYC